MIKEIRLHASIRKEKAREGGGKTCPFIGTRPYPNLLFLSFPDLLFFFSAALPSPRRLPQSVVDKHLFPPNRVTIQLSDGADTPRCTRRPLIAPLTHKLIKMNSRKQRKIHARLSPPPQTKPNSVATVRQGITSSPPPTPHHIQRTNKSRSRHTVLKLRQHKRNTKNKQ